jgi:uncharacterized protein involved in tolerance to divalent cations
MATDIVIVSIACGSDAEAQTLARLLVEQKLAACVQSHAITSTYVWRGAIETSAEIMLTAKTLTPRLPDIEAMVKTHHSYEVPEILAQPVTWANAAYEAWLRDTIA